MNIAEKAKAIAAWHDEWVKTAKYESIPVEGDSQYPETEPDVYTDPVSDDVYWARVAEILAEDEPLTAVVSDAEEPTVSDESSSGHCETF